MPRIVRVDRIELLSYSWPHLELEIECGGGTYIRSIARDVGEALGCGGLVETLVRTRIGPFTLEDSSDPTKLTRDSLPVILHPALAAVPDLPRITLDESQTRAIAQGRVLVATAMALDSFPQGEIALIDASGRLLAIAQADSTQRTIRPSKVLIGCNESR